MGFVEDPYVSVAFMTLSLGFNGASTMTSLQNAQGIQICCEKTFFYC